MRRRRSRRKKVIVGMGVCMIALSAAVIAVIAFAHAGDLLLGFPVSHYTETKKAQPDELQQQYVAYINEGRYEDMYAMLAEQIQTNTPAEDFISRNKGIYEGIEARNITVNVTALTEMEEQTIIGYDTRMDTLAGEIAFSNKAYFSITEDKEYRLIWSSQLIFPNLHSDSKVKVNTLKSERGSILDRNGEMLAGKGVASSVGFVPGKMNEDRTVDIEKAAELLDISVESINKKLSAFYVKDDMFIPIRTIPKGRDDFEELLLQIKGLKITDVVVRYYPLGEKASHLDIPRTGKQSGSLLTHGLKTPYTTNSAMIKVHQWL